MCNGCVFFMKLIRIINNEVNNRYVSMPNILMRGKKKLYFIELPAMCGQIYGNKLCIKNSCVQDSHVCVIHVTCSMLLRLVMLGAFAAHAVTLMKTFSE